MTTKEFISKSDTVRAAQTEAVGRLISWTLIGFNVGVIVFTAWRRDPHWDALPFTMLWFLGTLLPALHDVETGRTPAGLFFLQINLAMWVFATIVVATTFAPPGAGVGYVSSVTLLSAALGGPFLFSLCKARTVPAQFDLSCSGCHANLLPMRSVVIASRRCGRCGRDVLEESAPLCDASSEQAANVLLSTSNLRRRRRRVMFYLSVAITAVNIGLLTHLSQTNYVVPIPSDGHPPGLRSGPTTPVANVPQTTYLPISLNSTFPGFKPARDAGRAQFGVVAQQVVQVMEIMFKGHKVSDRRPIVVSQRKQSNFYATVDAHSDPRRIHLYFSEKVARDMIKDRSYAWFAFMLSRALANVVMNRRKEDALGETLATSVALETCDRLTDIYPEWDLPQEWQEYGANYKAYSRGLRNRLLKQSPANTARAIRLGQWDKITRLLTKYQHLVDTTHGEGDRWPWIMSGALALRSQGVPWPELVGFGTRTPAELRKTSPDLKKALSNWTLLTRNQTEGQKGAT